MPEGLAIKAFVPQPAVKTLHEWILPRRARGNVDRVYLTFLQVGLDRLEQDPLQAFCSKPREESGDAAVAAELRETAMASVVLPGNGDYLGSWERGQQVANNGKGLQYSDNPEEANGGNCYACHQLAPAEVAYGNLGPSLTNYGARGQSDVMLQYTWTKLWNTHAYNVCSHMPRFGAQGILTEQQLKDVMAFLFDPDSPVNNQAE